MQTEDLFIGHQSDYNGVIKSKGAKMDDTQRASKEMLRTFRGVAAKDLNRYAALFALIVMSVECSVAEAADHVRCILQTLRLSVTIKSAKVLNILAI